MVGIVGVGIVGREVQTDRATSTAEEFAGSLAALCRDDAPRALALGADCPRAERIARDGLDGADGDPGRGVLGTQLDDRGHLIVTYTDGIVVDVGRVVGAPGAPGEPGRGITSTLLDGGRFVVVFTDGERVDLGPVVGRDGVGVASLDGSTGRLLVTLTDGTVVDAGPLPQGPQGEQGERGEQGAAAPVVQSETRTYADGSVQRCVRSGGTDVDPEYSCETTPPPGDEGAPATTGATPAPPILGG